MNNDTIELSLMDPEEREQVEWMYNAIPEEDRKGITADDILFVLDAMDEYLEKEGLVDFDETTEEMTYQDCEVDETEQLEYVLDMAREDQRQLSSAQIQIIMDAEMQWGIKEGYYEEE